MAAKVPTIEIGTITPGISIALSSLKKTNTTSVVMRK